MSCTSIALRAAHLQHRTHGSHVTQSVCRTSCHRGLIPPQLCCDKAHHVIRVESALRCPGRGERAVKSAASSMHAGKAGKAARCIFHMVHQDTLAHADQNDITSTPDMLSLTVFSPVPRTNLDPRAGAGSNMGQSNVNAQIVNGTTELKERDCTTLPAYAESVHFTIAASHALYTVPMSLMMRSQLCLGHPHVGLVWHVRKAIAP